MRHAILTSSIIALFAAASGSALADAGNAQIINLRGPDARDIKVDQDGDGAADATARIVGRVSEIRGDVYVARYAVDLDRDGGADHWVLRAKPVGTSEEVPLDVARHRQDLDTVDISAVAPAD